MDAPENRPQEPAAGATHREGMVRAWLVPVSAGLLLGILGSVGAHAIELPLPNLLGPLIGCGVATITGLRLRPLPWSRELGQVVVGLAIGLRLAPSVVHAIVGLLPAMLISTLGVVIVTMSAALMLRALCHLDRETAFFSTAAVGLAEMAAVAHDRGGSAAIVSLVHTVRVAGLVTAVPLLVTLLGDAGGIPQPHAPLAGHGMEIAILIAVTAVAALIVRRLHVPNSWLLISIIIGSVVAAGDLSSVAMPAPVMVMAQIVIGIWLGCRFRRDLLLKLPRVTAAACVTTVLLLGAAALGAVVLSAATDLPFATSLLALAPAGVTEMVLTASLMRLDVPVITAFHVMRIVLITSTILLLFQAFNTVSKWLDRPRA
jgi:membrane AbrB-like protein